MSNLKIGIREVIKELDISRDKVEFTNDLNLFLNTIAFNESDKDYYDIVKDNFNDYMGKWEIDIQKHFSVISKYIKSRKLPYKIAKDEGFEHIKSEKFIISMLVELYAMKIIIENEKVSKDEIIKFIYKQFNENGLYVNEKDIILNDLDYLFKDFKLFLICRQSFISRNTEIKQSIDKIINAIESRKEIKLNLKYKINSKENMNLTREQDIFEQNLELKRTIDKLQSAIDLNNTLIEEYMDKEIKLQNEINKLQKHNIELIGYGQEQYTKALIDLVKNMNDSSNGNLLDRLYSYSRGYDEKSLMFVAKNLFNVLRQVGICPRETIKIGESVDIEEYSFYNYRFNKDISDIKMCEGTVVYPAWFYNNKEILKPYVTIKGD